MSMSLLELKLFCTLTDEEVQSRGRMLGETVSTIDNVNASRTEAMKGFKETLVGLNETQRKLARAIRERSEERIVNCRAQFHTPQEGQKRIIRLDTGEVVREELMTDAEKQLNLFAAQQEFARYMEKQEGLSITEVDEDRPADPDPDPDPQVQ